ncbi:MAG: type II toxin-antitoxin system RelE/ParE family toxin [Bacteroidales bacterium]|nr:type II toxin-antitoxin system RelE/ParE family toxin [Bacteroidales bacterium]
MKALTKKAKQKHMPCLKVPENYLKHIESTNGLYEISVKLGRDIFRIFCFFDQGKLINLSLIKNTYSF